MNVNIRQIKEGTVKLDALKEIIQGGGGPEVLKPFDELDITLDTGKVVTVTCGFVDNELARFVFKDSYGEYQMNETPTNKTGYFGSKGRKSVMEDIYPHLPQELRDIIRPRRIVETIGGETREYEDPLWIPSATDLFGSPEWKWWPDEPDSFQLPIFLKDRDRVKELKDYGTYPWWLRSVYAASTAGFCRVYTDGGANSNDAYISHGFAPGFDL